MTYYLLVLRGVERKRVIMKILNSVIILNVALILLFGFLFEHEDNIKQHRAKRMKSKHKK